MAAGKPILALTEDHSEIVRVIEEDRLGWFVPPHNSAKLLEMIYRIYEERDAIPLMGQRARRVALEKYSLETAIEKYNDYLAS